MMLLPQIGCEGLILELGRKLKPITKICCEYNFYLIVNISTVNFSHQLYLSKRKRTIHRSQFQFCLKNNAFRATCMTDQYILLTNFMEGWLPIVVLLVMHASSPTHTVHAHSDSEGSCSCGLAKLIWTKQCRGSLSLSDYKVNPPL